MRFEEVIGRYKDKIQTEMRMGEDIRATVKATHICCGDAKKPLHQNGPHPFGSQLAAFEVLSFTLNMAYCLIMSRIGLTFRKWVSHLFIHLPRPDRVFSFICLNQSYNVSILVSPSPFLYTHIPLTPLASKSPLPLSLSLFVCVYSKRANVLHPEIRVCPEVDGGAGQPTNQPDGCTDVILYTCVRVRIIEFLHWPVYPNLAQNDNFPIRKPFAQKRTRLNFMPIHSLHQKNPFLATPLSPLLSVQTLPYQRFERCMSAFSLSQLRPSVRRLRRRHRFEVLLVVRRSQSVTRRQTRECEESETTTVKERENQATQSCCSCCWSFVRVCVCGLQQRRERNAARGCRERRRATTQVEIALSG